MPPSCSGGTATAVQLRVLREMRVISGSAKGHRLQPVPGDSTRPITDRAKEALFSILGNWIEGRYVLDLFGGTGAVGIEALSRGAEHVQFVDRSRPAVRTILQNLAHCRVADRATVARRDSFEFLARFEGEPFDLVYIAPPQYKEMWQKALLAVEGCEALLVEESVVIVQIDPREETPIALESLIEFDRRRYGNVLLIFYEFVE